MGNGTQANNPWLQEMPDPLTRVSWDNYVTVSKSDAKSLGLKNKNLKLLNKKPLIYWAINAAKKSKFISEITVSTDSYKIKKEAEKLLKVWDDQGIRLEKARWGRFNLIKGKVKIEFPKGTDLDKFNDENVSDFFKKKKTKKNI